MKFRKPTTSDVTIFWLIIYFLFGLVLPGQGFDTEDNPVTNISLFLFICFGVTAFVERRKKKNGL
jgi:hypothetical protein